MQNFHDTSASPAPHRGFSAVVGASGRNSSYQPQPSEPHSSSRMPDEYAGGQQNPQTQNQHSSLSMSQAALMRGFEARNRGRGAEEMSQVNNKHGRDNGNNPYRKETMDYYFLMSSKDGQRRGSHGFAYGAGLGFLNLDGHVPHQYRTNRPASGTASGASQYLMDYSVATGSTVNRSSSTGTFSPSHQYSMPQSPSVTGPHVRRQRAQNYPSHQPLHQEQQHRGYPLSGQRLPPQFSDCPPTNAAAGSAGKCNSSSQGCYSGENARKCKTNNTGSANSNPSSDRNSTNSGSTQPFEGMGQSFPGSEYSYNSKLSHSRRNHQQNLGPSYETSHKIHPSNLLNQPGLSYPKHPPCSMSSSKSSTTSAVSSVHQFSSYEITKSPKHTPTQQPQFQQNFSPISNPSPAASLVQSPSCSSSPSPLMGSSDGLNNSTAPPALQPSYSLSNPRNGHNRLLQVMPQRSSTPNSNSSNSSCGSSGHVNTTSLNASPGGSHSVLTRKGLGYKGSDQCASSSLYSTSPIEKQVLDPGTNSLNALTSQVANLPNTVQHVLLSDSVLPNKGKDNGHQMQPSLHSSPTRQQRTTSSSSTLRREGGRRIDSHDINPKGTTDEDHMTEQSKEAQVEGDKLTLEGEDGTVRELRETNSVHDHQQSPSHVVIEASKTQKTQSPTSESLSQSKRIDYKTYKSITHSSLSSHIPSEGPSAVQVLPCSVTSHKSPMPSPTLISSSQPNCLEESEVLVIPKNKLRGREKKESSDATKKREMETNENEGKIFQSDKCQRGEGHDIEEMHNRKENEDEIHCQYSFNNREHKGGEKKHEMVQSAEDTQIEGGVGVIVSTRSEVIQPENVSQHLQAISASSCRPDQSNSLGIPSYCLNKENHSYSSFRDSSSHYGEDKRSAPTNASAHGEKLTGRPSASPHHLHPGSQKSPYRLSELVRGSGRSLSSDSVGLTEDGIAAKLNDQAYQQSPQHTAGLQRKVVTAEAEGQRVRTSALEPGRGLNPVQQQTFPSLLQEVLQGYHTDKRYRHTENIAQKLQTRNTLQFQNMPYQYNHSRNSNSMTENVRNHLLSQSRMPMNCHVPNESLSIGKTYPNQRREHETNMEQDTCLSWCSGETGSKEIQWSSFDKSKMKDSPNNQGNSMRQSLELSLQPHSENYAHPTRKPSSNELNFTSAVQQLLLKEAEPAAGTESSVGQVQLHSPSSSSSSLLPTLSSLERRSVICDLSPSHLTTPDRDRSSDKEDKVSILPQVGSSGSSVIQQSLSTSVINQEDGNKGEKVHKALREEALKTMKEVKISDKGNYSHSFTHETTIQPQSSVRQHSGPQQLDMIPDTSGTCSGGKGTVKTAKMTPLHLQQIPQQLIPTCNPLPSPSLSKFQAYFQGLDESRHHSTGVDGFGLRDSGETTIKMSPQHSYQLSHHNLPSTQPQNSQSTNKLQMYPHSLQHLHSLSDRLDWSFSNNQLSSRDLVMSPNSSQNHHHAGMRSADALANPQLPPLQSSYCDIGKMWGTSLPGRLNKGIMEGDTSRRNEPCTSLSPESVTLPTRQPLVSKNFESDLSSIVTEDIKPFHPVSTTIKQSDCSSINSGSGNSGSLGPQGKAKMGGSGDTNPLIMRRRVRSFISPIPAKRQHQDISQQQRGVSGLNPSLVSSSDVRHSVDIDSLSPDMPSLKPVSTSASLVSPSPSLGKLDILPQRKGRGLKLEAIVQKITPNIKPTTDDSESNTDSTSDNLSSLSHTEMACISDLKDHNSSAGENFSRLEIDSGSCLPYLNEGMSLEEIMSYRGVEETGPLPPTAYQCDLHQDTQILKCDLTEKQNRTAVGDLESVLDFGIGVPGDKKSELDTRGDRGKDEISPDFTLLGPLPPPPPLPRPVQVSSPPSSSALLDIQHATTTYQQLETRREHSAATLLRQKLEESEMCLALDDYSGRDYLGTESPHNNQNQSHCGLSIPPNSLPHQQHISAGATSSVIGQSQYTQMKPGENMVPKGYFPSGKKRGRPVGSVNKQKRVQGQSQNVSLNDSPVNQMPTHISASTPQAVVPGISSAISVNKTNSIDKTPTSLTFPTISQAAKEEIESEERETETESKPHGQRGRKKEHGVSEDDVVTTPTPRRRVVDVFEDEVKSAGIRGNMSSSGVFPTCMKPVFAPYIHVERKLEELGNVCTIVNAGDEKKKGESGEEKGGRWAGKEAGGGPVAPINSTLTTQLTRKDGERERVKEKSVAEKVNASHIHSSPTGKVLPSSGYVISGSVMTEIDTFGHLLCCLCKKWANYKDLGDLYGPYYPPEYATRFPKTPSIIRQSAGVTSVGTMGTLAGAAEFESTKQEITPVALQTFKPTTDPSFTGSQATDLLAATSMYVEAAVSALDKDSHCSNNSKEKNEDWDLPQNLTSTGEVLKQEELSNEVSVQLQREQHAENTQKRPQHRKLTSHQRFKRRHKSSEDVRKTGPTNSKALLPFQPPPPLPNQQSSDPSAPLSLLPQVPLDPDELWVHEGCIIWASGVYLINGRLYGVQEALDGARDTCCSHCMTMGSTLGCYSKGCTQSYHYLCATEAGCALNEDNFSMRCPKHKFPQNFRPTKPVCLEQSERLREREFNTEETGFHSDLLPGHISPPKKFCTFHKSHGQQKVASFDPPHGYGQSKKLALEGH